MRITDIIVESSQLDEIQRLPKSEFVGGKKYLDKNYAAGKTIKKLPGGSGLLYSIQQAGGEVNIRLWDPTSKGEFQGASTDTPRPSYYTRQEWESRVEYIERQNARKKAVFDRAPGKLIGDLSLSDAYRLPLIDSLQVNAITVDEDYRGIGIAKALYGIVLTILKRPLVAGSGQTPGGRRNWMSLSTIPGVEMKGYVRIDDDDLTTRNPDKLDRTSDKRWVKYQNKRVDKTIDIIMGQLGGQYIGKTGRIHYFTFDVRPDTTKQELKAYVDTNLSKIYGDYGTTTGLYAVWTGK